MKTWKKYFETPIIWGAISAITTLTSLACVSRIRHVSFTRGLLSWDSNYYRDIINMGYERHLPMNNGKIIPNRDAFFPIFPYLVKYIDKVFPGNYVSAYLFINIVASLAALVIFHYCAKEILPDDKARYATALFGVFPTTFIYFWMYPEAISVLVVVIAITLLVKKHPYWASAVFGVGAATRPNAVFMGLAPALYLLVEHLTTQKIAMTTRYVRSAFATLARILFSGLLAISGFVAFLWYISTITGVNGAWYRIQREGWNESTRPFYSLLSYAHHVLVLDWTVRVIIVSLSACIYFFAIYSLFKFCKDNHFSSLTVSLSVPSLIIILLALSNYSTAASLRFAVIAIPIFFALASTLRIQSKKYVIPLCIVMLFGFCFFYAWAHHAPFFMGSP